MIRNLHCRTLAILAIVLGTAVLDAEAAAPWTKIDVYPPDIHLSTSRDLQRVIAIATRADGVTVDVTAQAKLTLADPSLARIEANRLYPQADGDTSLKVEVEGHAAEVPVHVEHAQQDRPISFKLDVMPVFLRTGCNTGSCHGAARGKDGFRLSLFGFDPDGDHFRLTREYGARRLNLAIPADSLLMEKSAGTVSHTGGKRMSIESEYYATMIRWIEAGAPLDAAEIPTVVGTEIFPRVAVIEGENSTQQFIVRAKYSDGTDRDITTLALFNTSNDNSAPVSENGLVTAAARGEAFVSARFDTHTEGAQVLVLPAELAYTPSQEKPVNYVDELVNAKLTKLRLEPSNLCTDEEFLRRITIDVVGMLPTSEEFQAFLADTDPEKRSKKVNELLERKEFAEIWAMKWAELLLVKTVQNQVEYKPMLLYSTWLTSQIENDVPLDKMVQEVLGSTGGTFSSPATNFYQVERDTLKVSENVAQIFMGMRIQCAQCHNHPFDRWTMDDYYSFAAFFSQIGRKTGEDYRETIVFNQGGGEVKHPVGGRNMPPKFLGGDSPDVAGKDRRRVLAEWIASPENPYFATSVANRVWAHFFGIGIVEPVDDVRVSNPPSNPELFQALGGKLTEYGYDFKQLVRDICNSNAYQRSTERNPSNQQDELNFAHARIRRIPAETMLDSICQVTENQEKFPGLPLGSRAVQIADGRTSTYFLTTFGRSDRETVCACEATTDPSLSQSLHMLNGEAGYRKIQAGKVVEKLLEAGKTPAEVLEELYIRCLTRKPTEMERGRLLELAGSEAKPVGELQDIFWALLNSREFVFNH